MENHYGGDLHISNLNIDMDDIWLTEFQNNKPLLDQTSPSSSSSNEISFFDEASFFDEFVDTFTSCRSPDSNPSQDSLSGTINYNQYRQICENDHITGLSVGVGNLGLANHSVSSNYAVDNQLGTNFGTRGIAMPFNWQNNSSNTTSVINPSYSFSYLSNGSHNNGMTQSTSTCPMTIRPSGQINRCHSMHTSSSIEQSNGRSSSNMNRFYPSPPHNSPCPMTVSHQLSPQLTPLQDNIDWNKIDDTPRFESIDKYPAGRNKDQDRVNTSRYELVNLSSVSNDANDTNAYYNSPQTARGGLPRPSSIRGVPPSPKSTSTTLSHGASSNASSPRKRKFKGSNCANATTAREPPLTYGGSSSSRKSKKIHSMLEDLVTILQSLKKNDIKIKDLAATPPSMNSNHTIQDSPPLSMEGLSISSPSIGKIKSLPPSGYRFDHSSPSSGVGLLSPSQNINETPVIPLPKSISGGATLPHSYARQREVGLNLVQAVFGLPSTLSLTQICHHDAKVSYPPSFFPILNHLATTIFPTTSTSTMESGNHHRTHLRDESKPIPTSTHLIIGTSNVLSLGNVIQSIFHELFQSNQTNITMTDNSYHMEVNDNGLGQDLKQRSKQRFFSSATGFTYPFIIKIQFPSIKDIKSDNIMKEESKIDGKEEMKKNNSPPCSPLTMSLRRNNHHNKNLQQSYISQSSIIINDIVIIEGMLKCVEDDQKIIGAKVVFDPYDFLRQCVEKCVLKDSVMESISLASVSHEVSSKI